MILLFSIFDFFRKNKSNPILKSGQIWKYITRHEEEASRVLILKIQDYGEIGEIVHVAVNGLKLGSDSANGKLMTEIGHMPFDKKAIEQSLTECEGIVDQLPDFMGGYNEWKEAFDSGKGGVFTIEVRKAVAFIDESL